MKNQVVSIDKILKYVATEEVVYQEFEGLVEVSNDSIAPKEILRLIIKAVGEKIGNIKIIEE